MLFYSFLFFVIIFSIIFLPKLIPANYKFLENHTNDIDAIPKQHLGLWIAWAAGLSLFVELMMIRIHSSHFPLFAYFKNVSLLSCFLGLGIGYARGGRRPLSTPLALPLLAIQIILIYGLRLSPFAKILQNPIAEQFSFGLEQARGIHHTLFVYSFLALIFTINALCFIPLGHLISRLMMRKKKLIAYSWNLIGSLAGVFIFFLVSFIWAPPAIWIILAAAALMVFLYKNIVNFYLSFIAVIIVLVIMLFPNRLNRFDIYSPYQMLTLTLSPDFPPIIDSGNRYYQVILDLSEKNIRNNKRLKKWSHYYALPYLYKPKPENVLIVGSGSGNDVAAAIRNGAENIDAVEIDPAIVEFGKQLHPESPYQARNVNIFIADARTFIRYTNKRYDLIVYGLLDSHTLLSGRSGGIRLDSYIYTVEAFREARRKLSDGGILSLTFGYLSPQIGRKLFLMLKEAFDGHNPIVYQAGETKKYTFLIGNKLKKRDLKQLSPLKETTSKYENDKIRADKSTDDWPYLYMPTRKYPLTYTVMILILLTISIIFIRQYISGSGGGFSVPCFFLGAGFMLVETKGITEFALLYGSTWMVIGIVIIFVLIMALLANLLVIKVGIPSLPITYGLLFISLIIGISLTYANLDSFTLWQSRIIISSVLTLPLFFSGLVFSVELSKSASVAVALSSNLLGSMLGGFLEYNSMYFGFRALYVFAFIMYGLAYLGSMKFKKS